MVGKRYWAANGSRSGIVGQHQEANGERPTVCGPWWAANRGRGPAVGGHQHGGKEYAASTMRPIVGDYDSAANAWRPIVSGPCPVDPSLAPVVGRSADRYVDRSAVSLAPVIVVDRSIGRSGHRGARATKVGVWAQ